MCEQTEIDYLDGDIVWVKLSRCWWPGQVTAFENLPDDIQAEFKQKPLIAAVKFFQEDTFEFVKNYQRIYKYNCTQKDEFIKKGLDKYRNRGKDGSTYMDKFPGDVETAEKLVGGDPDILSHEKFSAEEKPDISGLFGEKKIPKKKRDRDDSSRRNSDGFGIHRKITHPRFLVENDHEVRIRPQPSGSGSSSGTALYPCHLCSFTCTRVNVIICHIKSHKFGTPSTTKAKSRSLSHSKSKYSVSPKKEPSQTKKEHVKRSKTDSGSESAKRKYTKQSDKASKKKKTDPELREKLLADWDDGSDEDIPMDFNKSLDSSLEDKSLEIEEASVSEENKEDKDATDENDLLEQTERLLLETEKLRDIHVESNLTKSLKNSLSKVSDSEEKFDSEKDKAKKSDEKKGKEEKANSEKEAKTNDVKNDEKSRLACFDFVEEDVPEPSPVRKIPRVSLKKDIIKEFEMSQALQSEQEKDTSVKNNIVVEVEVHVGADKNEKKERGKKEEKKIKDVINNEKEGEQNRNSNACDTEVEIVEIVEVEREEEEPEVQPVVDFPKFGEGERTDSVKDEKEDKVSVDTPMEVEEDSKLSAVEEKKVHEPEETAPSEEVVEKKDDTVAVKDIEELSERVTTETEDETVSEAADLIHGHSETSDTDRATTPSQSGDTDGDNTSVEKIIARIVEDPAEKVVIRKRGRPPKNLSTIEPHKDASGNGDLLPKDLDSPKTEGSGKASESDTDRSSSYSGRRRKPNKKYSDFILRDTEQKVVKTDESQSETEEKALEKPKTKSKRGRKSHKKVLEPEVSKEMLEFEKDTNVGKSEEAEVDVDFKISSSSSDRMDLLKALGSPERDSHADDAKADLDEPSNEIQIPKTDESKSEENVEISSVSEEAKNDVDVKVLESENEKTEEEGEGMKINPDEEKVTEEITEAPEVEIKAAVEEKEEIGEKIEEDVQKIEEEIVIEKIAEDNNEKIVEEVVPEKMAEKVEEKIVEGTVKPNQEDAEMQQPSHPPKVEVEMLPPKKSQIKKFELSQIDFFESDASLDRSVIEPEPEKRVDKIEDDMEIEMTKVKPNEELSGPFHKNITELVKEEISIFKSPKKGTLEVTKGDHSIIIEKATEIPETQIPKPETVVVEEKLEAPESLKIEKISAKVVTEVGAASPVKAAVEKKETAVKKPPQPRLKGKFTSNFGDKSKKDIDNTEEQPVNSFQEAFLKTLNIENLKNEKDEKVIGKKVPNDGENAVPKSDPAPEIKSQSGSEQPDNPTAVSSPKLIKVTIEDNAIVETELSDSFFQEVGQPATKDTSKAEVPLTSEEPPKTLTLEIQKLDDSSRLSSVSTPSPSSDSGVPVKKREKPRIIENVTLKEPMQILKSKLLEKLPSKSGKHKLEGETTTKELKSIPRSKFMKLELVSPNSKSRTITKATPQHLSMTKKYHLIKSDDATSPTILEVQNDKVVMKSPQTMTSSTANEKFIQQSSQSLADMELDIDSMPFVLSEDVLTPENIEQMPVVISSIIPATGSMPTTISFTSTAETVTANKTQQQRHNESPAQEPAPPKKKTGPPAILKSKSKTKPTITSIKTLVPPLTPGVKGLKFQNTQSGKSSPLLIQKPTLGKCVFVQTGGQQIRYSVQGRSGASQNVIIPQGKSSGNAQVEYQGGKVVILTSDQSAQAKMVPLGISKTLGGNVQRIVTGKKQVLYPINAQSGILTSKTIIAPKTDGTSPTTSRLSPGPKIINAQGLIPSKGGVYTQLQGPIPKSALLRTIPQGILKGGVFTSINPASLTGKTILDSQRTIVKGTQLLSPQNLAGTKTILAPVTQTVGGKTLLNAQTVSGKGTVLTPITGHQMKSMATKNPVKTTKIQYQTIPQKMQLQSMTKSGKVPISPSTQVRLAGTLKPASGSLVYQNTIPAQKVVGKKVLKQTVVGQNVSLAAGLSPQSKIKTLTSASASSLPKVVTPRRQTKAHQKTILQKEATLQSVPSSTSVVQTISSSAQTLQSKPSASPVTSRTTAQQKHTITSTSYAKSSPKTQSARNVVQQQQQQNLLNVAFNSIGGNLGIGTTAVSLAATAPLETVAKQKVDVQIQPEEVAPKEEPKLETSAIITKPSEQPVEKVAVEEPKVAAQPQIMMIPTENSDGTQSYILMTIDEQGQIQPLDNNTLMSLEGSTQNPDGTQTLYIDTSSLGDTGGTLDNIVLQLDNGVQPNAQTRTIAETAQPVITESFPSSEIIQTSNQDILAAALANTDFQQEIGLPENPTTSLTQTSLINQTILQSTIIPPTEPISSPLVLETSLTLNQPIMTPLEVPSSLPVQSESVPTSASMSSIPTSLELPITITNPSISYISASGETQIQIPGNSMPDIGEIMETSTTSTEIGGAEIPTSTKYLVISHLGENIGMETVESQSTNESMPTVTYSVLEPTQTTPSMPIIDDTYAEEVPFVQTVEKSKEEVPSVTEEFPKEASSVARTVSPGPQDVVIASEMIVSSHEIPVTSQEVFASSCEPIPIAVEEVGKDVTVETEVVTQEVTSESPAPPQPPAPASSPPPPPPPPAPPSSSPPPPPAPSTPPPTQESTSSMPIIDESCCTVTSESQVTVQSTEPMNFEVSNSTEGGPCTSYEAEAEVKADKIVERESQEELPVTSNIEDTTGNQVEASSEQQLPQEQVVEHMEVEESVETESQIVEASSQGEIGDNNLEKEFVGAEETSQEVPSQSYEQFNVSMANDNIEVSSQSTGKSENSREPSQSTRYERMETDEDLSSAEPPTQSFEDAKSNAVESTQSYESVSSETNTNAPTQSYSEVMQSQQEDRGASTVDEAIDDQSFPTQSYEVEKIENLSENLETDGEISQEGNIPSQSNDIDGIGTSGFMNNAIENEDETASSSYVPGTPENQERDQDQESAISTSSFEIPPCEELNIASSSEIPDTSVRGEHSVDVHDNGVPEIPTSSYNLNPDSSSSTTHLDSAPTSSYEDQVIVEQNVSTSYEVPISMPGLTEETSSQNFVTESTDHRHKPSSYYHHHHQEVTPSYYESVNDGSDSRIGEDGSNQEEVTPSYYDGGHPQDVTSEASQSYFPEEASTSYSNRNVSPSYYATGRTESEASQSFYSTNDLERNSSSSTSTAAATGSGQSGSTQNVEASQSFYQERTEEMGMRQQGEATPTYAERYPADYALDSSPIERHDLVESSVPATRPAER